MLGLRRVKKGVLGEKVRGSGQKWRPGSRNRVFEDDDGRLSELWSLKRHNSNRLSDFGLA